jgi:hypothetical protein
LFILVEPCFDLAVIRLQQCNRQRVAATGPAPASERAFDAVDLLVVAMELSQLLSQFSLEHAPASAVPEATVRSSTSA